MVTTNAGTVAAMSPGSVLMGADLAGMAMENLAAIGDGLVTIEGGAFLMGCETGGADERPVHKVTVDTFRMGINTVTNEEFGRFVAGLGTRRFALVGAHPGTGVERVLALGDAEQTVRAAVQDVRVEEFFPGVGAILTMGGLKAFADGLRVVKMEDHNPPSGFDRPRQPAVNVTWYRSLVFAFLHGCKLPTEAQWEYAARVVKGNGELREYATASGHLNVDGVKHAHYAEKATADVDNPRYAALLNGLRQMAGNVWEWQQDWYGPYPQGPVTNPTGPAGGQYKSLRGGSWNLYPVLLRAANRYLGAPDGRNGDVGFRLAALPQDSKG